MSEPQGPCASPVPETIRLSRGATAWEKYSMVRDLDSERSEARDSRECQQLEDMRRQKNTERQRHLLRCKESLTFCQQEVAEAEGTRTRSARLVATLREELMHARQERDALLRERDVLVSQLEDALRGKQVARDDASLLRLQLKNEADTHNRELRRQVQFVEWERDLVSCKRDSKLQEMVITAGLQVDDVEAKVQCLASLLYSQKQTQHEQRAVAERESEQRIAECEAVKMQLSETKQRLNEAHREMQTRKARAVAECTSLHEMLQMVHDETKDTRADCERESQEYMHRLLQAASESVGKQRDQVAQTEKLGPDPEPRTVSVFKVADVDVVLDGFEEAVHEISVLQSRLRVWLNVQSCDEHDAGQEVQQEEETAHDAGPQCDRERHWWSGYSGQRCNKTAVRQPAQCGPSAARAPLQATRSLQSLQERDMTSRCVVEELGSGATGQRCATGVAEHTPRSDAVHMMLDTSDQESGATVTPGAKRLNVEAARGWALSDFAGVPNHEYLPLPATRSHGSVDPAPRHQRTHGGWALTDYAKNE